MLETSWRKELKDPVKHRDRRGLHAAAVKIMASTKPKEER